MSGKEYDVVFNSLLQCNMDRELVIKLHRTKKPQIQSVKSIADSTVLSEDEIQSALESSTHCVTTAETIHRDEGVTSPNPHPQLEKQASSVSLDVQNSVSTLDLDFSLGTGSNGSISNGNRTSSNANVEQYPGNPSSNTTHGENPVQGSWVSEQHSHIPHPCYTKYTNPSPYHSHPTYQQGMYPGGYDSVVVPNHPFGIAMGNNYAQGVYPMVHHGPTDSTHYEHYEQSALEIATGTQMEEVQSRSCADSWFIPTYHAPAPIIRYWLVPAPFANVFHYGPSHFIMPEPPNSVIQ